MSGNNNFIGNKSDTEKETDNKSIPGRQILLLQSNVHFHARELIVGAVNTCTPCMSHTESLIIAIAIIIIIFVNCSNP